MRIVAIEIEPLSVPLREPFVIASGRVDATMAALVRVVAEDGAGRRVDGYGEAATLPPVTDEDQADLLRELPPVAAQLAGTRWSEPEQLAGPLDAALGRRPAARAGLECALLDAMARLRGVTLRTLLALDGVPVRALRTDITIPICPAERMAELARSWRAQGFDRFKVKVGIDAEADRRGLEAIAGAAPDARVRLDANGGYAADEALALVRDCRARGLRLELLEQPCARGNLEGMARVTATSPIPIVADESVRTLAELEAVHAAGAAHGVNLKLAKSGGLLASRAIGRRARQLGLSVMVGGMVETRLGMSAMAQLAAALGGVDFVDLDTAWLLASDPFEGGYRERGPDYELPAAAGLGLAPHTS